MAVENKKEQKRNKREEKRQTLAQTMSIEELEREYKTRNRIFILFIILTVLSAFFRPWFYTIILIAITVREKRRKDDVAAGLSIKNGESAI